MPDSTAHYCRFRFLSVTNSSRHLSNARVAPRLVLPLIFGQSARVPLEKKVLRTFWLICVSISG